MPPGCVVSSHSCLCILMISFIFVKKRFQISFSSISRMHSILCSLEEFLTNTWKRFSLYHKVKFNALASGPQTCFACRLDISNVPLLRVLFWFQFSHVKYLGCDIKIFTPHHMPSTAFFCVDCDSEHNKQDLWPFCADWKWIWQTWLAC